jgi:hypothetical protein
MKTTEHALAQFMRWNEAAHIGADGPTYQPNLSGSELIAELRELFATRRRVEQLICRYLADLADRIAQRRDVLLGAYADELHAARCFFGLGVRETRERVRVGRALRNLPRIEQAFIEGELSYSRAREVTRVATPHTESAWLALAQTLDMRAFERRVAAQAAADSEAVVAAKGVARAERADEQRFSTQWLSSKTVRVSFELTAEAWALVERALEGARRASDARLGDGQALEAIARDALSAQTEGGDASDPRRAVVLYECRSCSRSELETGVGALELDQARAASLGCGATVHDLESEGRTVTRGRPLPAAQSRGGEHSRRNCLVLCTTHHELLHDGKLTVTGNADHELSFCDASGRPIVAAATHFELARDVELHATQRGSLRDVGPYAIEVEPSVEGSLVSATRLLEVIGRRGGWTTDALIESSGFPAREVAAMLTWLELDGKVRNRAGAFEPV